MSINFITFKNTASNFSSERIVYEANKMDLFTNITVYSEEDFDEEFMERCGKEFGVFKRGYGYWSWKPYIIKKELEKLGDGDVVVYADCGCMLQPKNRKTLKEWANRVRESESGVLSVCYGPYVEHDWTRGDLHDYINKTYNKNNIDIFDKAIQCGAGVVLFSKCNKSVDFINQWYDVMTNHFHLCTDEASSSPNHPNFKENRHDQSVFSMLSKIYGIETIETKNGILDKENSPIIAARCRDDKNTWKKPIEVLFDSQIYDLQKFGGISRMYSDIAKELNKNQIIENYSGSGVARGRYQEFYSRFSINKTNNEYLKDIYCDGTSEENIKKSVKELQKQDFDIFYPTFFMPYFLDYIGNKPFVMSVHDMIPEIYEEFFSRNDLQIVGKREMVKKASAIEVPTECTKKDLIRILGVDEKKIHVVGRALNPSFGQETYSKSVVDYEYILYVGQRNAYKRFDWFIKHIAPFLKNHKDIHIICTGNKFSLSELNLFKKYGIKERVHNMFADDTTMATLYKYAKFFVFSSEYEGFGLPILESYKMDCIALLNDNECFREVTDNNGMFFKLSEGESNLSEIAEKVYSLSEDERNTILRKQRLILDKYSYEKYMDNFKNMFRVVLTEKKGESVNGLDIFICTHKDFKPLVKDQAYKIINCNDINGDTWNGIKGSFYSEIMSYFYVAENYKLNDYVGFAHYRKYWGFMDNIDNLKDLISKSEIIVAKPIKFKYSIRKQYEVCHNIEDLYIASGIIGELYPNYIGTWNHILDGNMLIPFNMFIMKREEFFEYIKFMRAILDKFVNIIGKDIEKRITNNKEKYLKEFAPNNEVWYQYRIAGYLAERLTNLWIWTHHTRIGGVSVKITENKYKKWNNITYQSF